MSKFNKVLIFTLTMLFIFACYPLTVFANEFNPVEYWSSSDNTIKSDYSAFDGDAGFSGYKMVFWDNVNNRYLLIYSRQIISAYKSEIIGNGEYRQITSRCSYLGGGDSQGSWVLEYSPFDKQFYVADSNCGWTLLTKNVDSYYNVKEPYKTTIGVYSNYEPITSNKPSDYTESVNSFYTKISNSDVTTISKLNVDYNGILNEIVLILPIVISVLITYLAIRKGLGFLKNSIQAS